MGIFPALQINKSVNVYMNSVKKACESFCLYT